MNYFAVFVLICVAVAAQDSTKKPKRNKTYSALNSIIFKNIEIPEDDVHSEYYFGKCATENKMEILHEQLLYEQVKGKIIVRGHLNLTPDLIPNCVYIKATSPHGDMVRYNAYKLSVCILKVVVYYMAEIFHYFYYEWFIPVQMREGINWDLYFYIAYPTRALVV